MKIIDIVKIIITFNIFISYQYGHAKSMTILIFVNLKFNELKNNYFSNHIFIAFNNKFKILFAKFDSVLLSSDGLSISTSVS